MFWRIATLIKFEFVSCLNFNFVILIKKKPEPKFEFVSCSKLQVCNFDKKKPEPSCPTDPPRSISRRKLVPERNISLDF